MIGMTAAAEIKDIKCYKRVEPEFIWVCACGERGSEAKQLPQEHERQLEVCFLFYISAHPDLS